MGWPVAGCATLPEKSSSPSSVSRSWARRTGIASAASFRPAIWFSRSRGILVMMVCSPSDIGPELTSTQEVAGDHHPLHLARPLADLAELGVAEVALHRVVAGVAVAAVDLDG